MADILIIEDDEPINELIFKNLSLIGHKCVQCFDGNSALQYTQNNSIDLILLDIMLPHISGFDLISYFKDTPVIFVTAKEGLSDRLKGLTCGAEDYIIKPFEILELIARVNIVLRRYQKSPLSFKTEDIFIDFAARRIFCSNQPIELTPQEYDLLEVLVKNRNIALSREKLLELAWGYDFYGDTRTVDTHIQKLRKKLNWENKIKTVYKMGYRLEVIE